MDLHHGRIDKLFGSYGFIKDEGDGRTYFFHGGLLTRGTTMSDFREGDKVAYAEHTPENDRGPRAKNVHLA